ncbi:Subtilase family protein [Cohaesibacter sp. ES.047]|uniref:S8 family serine peptidase n=1 Tax=Cohaesibacter sp. ES.047 TaxID=1798205 RepID=UPI000BB97199|nr:S8 family serine peptidase [Cohaesibacter sp. ES.047]SNY93510.1 Subtilase family protein [Cohaesibacter sp. ES.047]
MADFDKPHIDISRRSHTRQYQASRQNIGGGAAPRIRAQHGERIKAEMREAFIQADAIRPNDDRLDEPEGVFLEVDLRRGTNPINTLERKTNQIRPGAISTTQDNDLRVALFVPDKARPVLESILDEYINGDLNARSEPPQKDKIEPIESIRQARLETFWTDEPNSLPENAQDEIWWEVWCYAELTDKVTEAAQSINCIVSEEHYWLVFPESTVIPIRAPRVTIELLLFATAGISELRRATASPVFFIEADREEQIHWTENLAERVTWPANDVPSVCVLDTGVNRGHMLLEPAVSADDLLTVNPDWEVDDHAGHGTGMAGISLLGDLAPRLEDLSTISLLHRVESVKILPPNGFPDNDPGSYTKGVKF